MKEATRAWLIIFALCYPGTVCGAYQRDGDVVSVSPRILREQAVTSPMPRYPAASLKAGITGAAVAEVRVALDGKVIGVRVVEAPDRHIGEAVEGALLKWRFGTTRASKTVRELRTRFTFYFRIEAGRGVVERSGEEFRIGG